MNIFKDSKLLFYISVFSFAFLFLVNFDKDFMGAPSVAGLASNSNSQESSDSCVPQGCHGARVTCGTDMGYACTAVYLPGDGCRNLAKCGASGNTCVLKNSAIVDSCADCVEKRCSSGNGANVEKCEQSCIQQALGR